MEIICRICRNTRRKKLIPLLKIVPNSNELEIEGEKFEYCLGLKILEIPNYFGICTACEQQLNDFYTFKQKAIKSHYELLEITTKNDAINNDDTEKTSESLSDFDDLDSFGDDKDSLILGTMGRVITDSDDDFFNSLGTEEKEFENELKKIRKNKIVETDHISLEMLVDEDGDCPIKTESNHNKENMGHSTKEIESKIKQENVDRTSPETFNDDFELTGFNDEDSFNMEKSKLLIKKAGSTKIKSEEIELDEKPSVEHCDDELQKHQAQELTKIRQKNKKKSKKVQKDNDSIPQNKKSGKLKSEISKKLTKNSQKSQGDIKLNELVVPTRKAPTKIVKTADVMNKTFKCELCTSRFNVQQKFEGHMNEHKGLPAYQCNICGKTYKIDRRCDFNDHMKDHQGIARRNICELCSKGFHTERDLNVHMRSHNDERPFVCDVCGRGFRTLGPLNYHKDSHNEEKKYKCEVCGQLFLLRAALKRHLREDHSNRTFQCEKCDRTFKKRTYFRMHISKYHYDLMEKLFPRRREFYKFQRSTSEQL